MHPILFYFPDFFPLVGGRPVFSYGFMLGLSFLAGWGLCVRWAGRDGFSEKVIFRSLILAVVFSLLGARAFHFISNPGNLHSVADFFRFTNGGLVAYGGFIVGSGALIIYQRFFAKTSYWSFGDHSAPGLALGLGLTRLGCFMFGCDFGRPSESAIAINFPMWSAEQTVSLQQHGSPPFYHHFSNTYHDIYDHVSQQVGQMQAAARSGYEGMGETWIAFEAKLQTLGVVAMGGESFSVLPSQLLASANGFLAFLMLALLHRYRRFEGQVLLVFAMYYSVTRFLLEMTRDDPQRGMIGGLSTSQVIGLGVFVLCGALYLRRRKTGRLENKPEPA